jgi:hypothetical protein
VTGPRPATRSLKVRCSNWDQVEAFYRTKLLADQTMVIRVPFVPAQGATVTVALTLPDQSVIAIAGQALAVAAASSGKSAQIRLKLVGLTDQLRSELDALVAAGRAHTPAAAKLPGRVARAQSAPAPTHPRPPAPAPTDVPVDDVVEPWAMPSGEHVAPDERDLFAALEIELARLREAPAHEVLGVSWEPQVAELRRGYFALVKKYHPDGYARYRSPGIALLASELFIHVNRAYDRMRDALASAGSGLIAGPALLPHDGWLAGFDEVTGTGDALQPAEPVPALAAAPPARARKVSVPPPIPRPNPAPTPGPPRPAAAPRPRPNVRPAPSDVDVILTVDFVGDEVTDVPITDLTLFGDIEEPSAEIGARPTTNSQISGLFSSGEVSAADRSRTDEMEQDARSMLASGSPALARDILIQALNIQPRNRGLRALYHLASGHCLLAEGRHVDARTQFETALAHDPDCALAQEALAAGQSRRRAGRASWLGRKRDP